MEGIAVPDLSFAVSAPFRTWREENEGGTEDKGG